MRILRTLLDETSSSTVKHKTNHIRLNSLNRQALTGIDRWSDGGMWMSHVFSIIYTALLFLSPPLRQVSIPLHHNQSVICQTLSIRRLIYVIYCGWLHASVSARKEQIVERGVLREDTKFWVQINRVFASRFNLDMRRQKTTVRLQNVCNFFDFCLKHTRGGTRGESLITWKLPSSHVLWRRLSCQSSLLK